MGVTVESPEARARRLAAPWGPDVVRGGAADAVVVGSGAGGGPVALALARAGYRVVVLEKGPRYRRRDFVRDEVGVCRRDFFVPFASDEPHVRVDEEGRAARTSEGWTSACVGGATVHMSGFYYRLHPLDLRLRSRLGSVQGAAVADWPLSWKELEPYYDMAERELGVSGVAGKNPFEPPRSAYPLPPLREHGFARLIDDAGAKLGLHPYPTARAIVSRPYRGRAPCHYHFLCGSYGCDVGAKSSSLEALLPGAVATGRCQVRPLSMVHRIELDARGRAAAVRYLDAGGAERRLRASVVVVACSAIESARLLLMSAARGHRDGLGNAAGLLGRHLMLLGHGEGIGELPRDDPRMEAIDWREPFVHRSVQDLYTVARRGQRNMKGGTLNFLLPHANPIFTAERIATEGARPIWGHALKEALRHRYRRVRPLAVEAFTECLPVRASRVTLDPEVKDRFGLPVARFAPRQHPRDREVNAAVLARGLDLLRALGASRVRALAEGAQTPWLQAGTCRFGDDPGASVLDRDCRVRGVPNLFVTDSSFMPTSGGVPHTLTIQANAFRVASRIVALGKRGDLTGPSRE